jgi:uncharacterized protein (DUF2267 family)
MSNTGLRGFDRTLQETNTWLHEISEEMNHPSRKVAYHALRGVLFALRDRLPVEEVFDLSAQLPMLIRGFYFEGYRLAGKPHKYHKKEFLELVGRELQGAGGGGAEHATQAVFRVMERHIGEGELADVRHALPKDLRDLWPGDGRPDALQ